MAGGPTRSRPVCDVPRRRPDCELAWKALSVRGSSYTKRQYPSDQVYFTLTCLTQGWTDLYTSWSPLGTYIATLHRQGLRLWGGASWSAQQRFAHPFVKLIDFSPCENYLVTWSHDPIVVPEGAPQGPTYFSPEDEGNNIGVWDIKTGNLLRSFPTIHVEAEDGGKKQMAWPALKWSSDDAFVARITPGQQISVYELPSMGLQGKKSIKIEGVVDFEWCPIGDKDREDAEKDAQAGGKGPKKARENMLSYWTPEVANQPARVTLMDFPGRQILRQKNLFNVTEVGFVSSVPPEHR
jgi:translation initiation factor 3 subunit B